MKTGADKSADTTSTSATRATQEPFFAKSGEGGFFESAKQSHTPFIQTKLTINEPGDPYEQEADRMADQVVQRLAMPSQEGAKSPLSPTGHQPSGIIQTKCDACEQEEKIQRKEEEGPEEQEEIQRKEESASPGTPNDDGLSTLLNASKGGGSPLPKDTRADMESAFGADFSGVRVHTGREAVAMSQDIHAQAFTHGSDVYFNEGKFDPGSGEGKKLLAHELTHTVQQGGSILSNKVQRDSPDADEVNAVMQYLNKLDNFGEIQKDKKNARASIERWKLGHSVAVLTINQKKLLIEELLIDGSPSEVDESLIIDLVEFSEVVHTKKLCIYIEDKIKDAAINVQDDKRIAFSELNYQRYLNIVNTRAKDKSTSSDTFSSDKVRELIERAYRNAIRRPGKDHYYDNTDFKKFGDEEIRIECIQIMRRVVLEELYREIEGDKKEEYDKIIKKVEDYCLREGETESGKKKEGNTVQDAMNAMMDMGYATKIKEFPFEEEQEPFTSAVDGSTKTLSVPKKIIGSVWGTIEAIIDKKEGWHMFPASPLDGFHTITFMVNVRPGGPFLYWVDQLDKTEQKDTEQYRNPDGTAPGIRQLLPEKLDEYISYTTNFFWGLARKNSKDKLLDTTSTFFLWQLHVNKKQ